MDKSNVTIRCTALVGGRPYLVQMAVARSVWDKADDQWRAEFLDTCRLRCAVQAKKDTGVDLTEQQTAAVTAEVDLASTSVTVELHGGPLDGQTVPVTLDDDDPWTAIISDGCAYPGGRSLYAPDTAGRWVWQHDLPWEAM